MNNEQFKAIIPPEDGSEKRPKDNKKPEEKIQPSNENPIVETLDTISFMGVELPKGQGGPRTPDRELTLKGKAFTKFDLQTFRDVAIGLVMKQPVLLEGGAGVGKTKAIEIMSALMNREVYKIPCHDMLPEDLVGTFIKDPDPESKLGANWADGDVILAMKNGGILFLDEINFMKTEVRAVLSPILTAVAGGEKTYILKQNGGEIVDIHPDFRIVAAMNPPGGEYKGRESFGPEELGRFNYMSIGEDLSNQDKKSRLLGSMNKDNTIDFNRDEYVVMGEELTLETLGEIPGAVEIFEKWIDSNMIQTLRSLIESSEISSKQYQKPSFTFRDDIKIRDFVAKFYTGDMNKVFQMALRYYILNKFTSKEDREKVQLMLDEIRVDIQPDSRRTGLDDIKKRKQKKETAESEGESFDEEFKGLEKTFKDISKEFIDSTTPTHEHYLTTTHPFLIETYKDKWSYTEEQLKIVEQVTSNPENIHITQDIPFEDLKEINKDSAKVEANKSQAGELYLSPELIEDYEGKKAFIPTISEDITSKGLSAVLTHIHETYKDTHILPDITYMHYLCELADQSEQESDETKKQALLNKIPTQLRDGKYYFFPGSAFVFELGCWLSPCVCWRVSSFRRFANRLDGSWDSGNRVVLLER